MEGMRGQYAFAPPPNKPYRGSDHMHAPAPFQKGERAMHDHLLRPHGRFFLFKKLIQKRMALSRQKKQETITKLKKAIESPSIAFVSFKGLKVSQAMKLRRTLRSEGIGYVVAKKTLIAKAFEGAPIKGELPVLDGEVAMAWGIDPVAPARNLHTFAKANDGVLTLIGGVYDGAFIGKDMITTLASIPSRQTLYAQFVNLINSPIARVAVALDQIAKKKV